MTTKPVVRRETPVPVVVEHRVFRKCAKENFFDARKEMYTAMVEEVGFTVWGEPQLEVDPGGGFSYSVLLKESGLMIHTWPERDYSLDLVLHYCNPTRDNADKAEKLLLLLKKHFGPQEIKIADISTNI